MIEAVARRLPEPLRGAAERWLGSPTGARLARGVWWSLVGLVASRGLTLAANVAAARILGRSGLGELDIVLNTVAFVGVVAGMGLGTAATRQVACLRAAEPARVGRIVVLATTLAIVSGAVMAIVLAAVAPRLAADVLDAPHLSPAIRLASPLLLLGAITGLQTGVLAGWESFKATAAVSAASAAVLLPAMVAGTWLAGLGGAVAASTLALAVAAVLNHVALRRRAAREGVRLDFAGCAAEARPLLAIAVPAVVSALLVAPVEWAARAILVRGPGGYAELGDFNVAAQWHAMVVFLPVVLGQPLLPVLSETWARGGAAACRRTVVDSIRLNVLVVAPVVVLGCAASPFLARMYGPAFAGAWAPLTTMLVCAGVVAAQWPVGLYLAASGRMWLGAATNAVWAAVYLGLAHALSDRGATGLALARLAAYAVLVAWSAAILARVPAEPAAAPGDRCAS